MEVSKMRFFSLKPRARERPNLKFIMNRHLMTIRIRNNHKLSNNNSII